MLSFLERSVKCNVQYQRILRSADVSECHSFESVVNRQVGMSVDGQLSQQSRL